MKTFLLFEEKKYERIRSIKKALATNADARPSGTNIVGNYIFSMFQFFSIDARVRTE